MLSFNKSKDIPVDPIDNLANRVSADADGTAHASMEHSDPKIQNDHNSVETITSENLIIAQSAQHEKQNK